MTVEMFNLILDHMKPKRVNLGVQGQVIKGTVTQSPNLPGIAIISTSVFSAGDVFVNIADISVVERG